jgi:hypothetical protein
LLDSFWPIMRGYPAIFLPEHEIGETQDTTKKSNYQCGPAESPGQDHAREASESKNWHGYEADNRKESDKYVSVGSITLVEAVESFSIAAGTELVYPGCRKQNEKRTNRYRLQHSQQGHTASVSLPCLRCDF